MTNPQKIDRLKAFLFEKQVPFRVVSIRNGGQDMGIHVVFPSKVKEDPEWPTIETRVKDTGVAIGFVLGEVP